MAAARPLACELEGPDCELDGTFGGRAGAEISIDGRTDSSSTQYGTACHACRGSSAAMTKMQWRF